MHLTAPRPKHNLYVQFTPSTGRVYMFPTRILLAVDGFRETSSAVRAAVRLASGTGSEVHVAHVVPTTPELPYLHLAVKERIGNFQ